MDVWYALTSSDEWVEDESFSIIKGNLIHDKLDCVKRRISVIRRTPQDSISMTNQIFFHLYLDISPTDIDEDIRLLKSSLTSALAWACAVPQESFTLLYVEECLVNLPFIPIDCFAYKVTVRLRVTNKQDSGVRKSSRSVYNQIVDQLSVEDSPLLSGHKFSNVFKSNIIAIEEVEHVHPTDPIDLVFSSSGILSWKAPLSDGGSDISHYIIEGSLNLTPSTCFARLSCGQDPTFIPIGKVDHSYTTSTFSFIISLEEQRRLKIRNLRVTPVTYKTFSSSTCFATINLP